MRGHVRVDVLREADPDRDLDIPEALLDRDAAPQQIVPRGGAVGEPDRAPGALQVVAGIRHPVVGEGEPLPGVGVVRALPDERHDRPVPPLRLAVDVGEIEHLLLERRRRREEEEQVVPGLGCHLGVRPRDDVRERDVVDRDPDAFPLAPLLRPGVEPGVERGDEVAPGHDAQFPLLRPRHRGEQRAELARRGGGAGGARRELQEVAARQATPAVIGYPDPLAVRRILHPLHHPLRNAPRSGAIQTGRKRSNLA